MNRRGLFGLIVGALAAPFVKLRAPTIVEEESWYLEGMSYTVVSDLIYSADMLATNAILGDLLWKEVAGEAYTSTKRRRKCPRRGG